MPEVSIHHLPQSPAAADACGGSHPIPRRALDALCKAVVRRATLSLLGCVIPLGS